MLWIFSYKDNFSLSLRKLTSSTVNYEPDSSASGAKRVKLYSCSLPPRKWTCRQANKGLDFFFWNALRTRVKEVLVVGISIGLMTRRMSGYDRKNLKNILWCWEKYGSATKVDECAWGSHFNTSYSKNYLVLCCNKYINFYVTIRKRCTHSILVDKILFIL